ncbi:MAG TPA: hypothetical protein VFB31_17940 [Pseudolabrys sp.]|nr:hypothetical protein [Pseudolabrys sp.]
MSSSTETADRPQRTGRRAEARPSGRPGGQGATHGVFDARVFADVGMMLTRTRTQLFPAMAARLAERYGSRIHLYVRSEEELGGFRNLAEPDYVDSIAVAADPAELTLDPVADRDALLRAAAALERRIGVSYGQLAMSSRALSRGYFNGAIFHGKPDYLAKTDDLMILQAQVRTLQFWDREILAKNITLLLDADMYAAVMCRAHDVPVRILEPGRYGNRMIWSVNERRHTPQIAKAYATVQNAPEPDLAKPYAAPLTKYARFWRERGTLWRALFATATGLAYGLFYRLRAYKVAKKISIWDRVTVPLKFYVRTRRAKRACNVRLADLEGRRFAYFPMHKEPEVWNMMRSPECFNQFAVVQAVSRDLPAGTLLAIKENLYSTSFRPPYYYDQLKSLNNVVLLDLRENSIDCIKQAAVTVTISGSAGMEAAVLGKPVIAFGRQTGYGFLPHVKTVTDDIDLRGYLRWAFDGDFDEARARRDGARYLEAVRQATFDAGKFRLVRDKTSGASDDVAERALENLIESLDQPYTDDPAPVR